MSLELPLPPSYLLISLGLFHFAGLSRYHSPLLKLPGDSIDAAERLIVLIDDVLEELNSVHPGPCFY
jgi:hypothetical protein